MPDSRPIPSPHRRQKKTATPAAPDTIALVSTTASASTSSRRQHHHHEHTLGQGHEPDANAELVAAAAHPSSSSSPEIISSLPSSRTPSRYTTPLPEQQSGSAGATTTTAKTTTTTTASSSQPAIPTKKSVTIAAGGHDAPLLESSNKDAESLVSDDDDEEEEEDEDWLDGQDPSSATMPSDLRPPYRRPSEGKSYTPLLKNPESPRHKHENSYESTNGLGSHVGAGTGRPSTARRRSSLREQNPIEEAKRATRKRYIYAAFFLAISLVSFTVQTETAVYIQHTLKWNKAYAMLYFTHGSWTSLWFLQLAILRVQKWSMPWPVFWRRHRQNLHETALMVKYQDVHAPQTHAHENPWPWIVRTASFIACALTIAGGSWYVAVDMTSASDLTAIYNCSAFFAYAFSVPLLHERLRWSKITAVVVAIAGVLIVAYGDVKPSKHGSHSGGGAGGDNSPDSSEASNRSLGNIVIGVGSVLYGLYEVLYKKYMCPPDGTSPGRSMMFANLVGSLLGAFTLFVLWIPIPILNALGWESFAFPTGQASWLLAISTFSNAVFSGSFLVLISLTSPVLSSVAALLTIFLVALVDQLLPPPFGSPLTIAAIIGGCLIIGAFLLLAWATYIEIGEERRKKAEAGAVEESESESGDGVDAEDGMGRLLADTDRH